MSVEGVPSVDDVAGVVRASLYGPDVVRDGMTAFQVERAREDAQVSRIAEAVHALYASVLADAARHREALETVRAVGNRAAVQVADAALAEGSGGDER